MTTLTSLYGQSLSLLTDLYQLTMAYGYFQTGRAEEEAVFHLFFRKNPFKGGFAVACGLDPLLEYLESFRFDPSDLEYLATLVGNDGKPLFSSGFIDYLAGMKLSVTVDACPEGTVVFPHAPMIRVQGPLIQCQILETPLLNIFNFQSLIATKAARITTATKGEPVLEFGLRRAQGVDGGVSASRAAYVGGCIGTSNVLAGKLYGIPVKGTHAHSWVMAFGSEEESFERYAEAMPNNCIFLVDTYDTLEGVKNAIKVGRRLRERGHEMVGVRLDSGDLAYLSIEARKLLDAAGFEKAAIVASNDLDENIISSLKEQGAQIGVWGVGTKLATAYDQPALGGVYKLAAIRKPGEPWTYKIKLSEQAIKVSTPGLLQVRRFSEGNEHIADVIYNVEQGISSTPTMIDPMDMTRRRTIPANAAHEDLLVRVVEEGKRIYRSPSIDTMRDRTKEQLSKFHSGIKRFVHPHAYPVGLEQHLFDLKTRLILEARGFSDE